MKLELTELEGLELMNPRAFEYYNRLRKIKSFVDENYSEEISLDKAARIAAMEKTYFSSFFSQKVGVPFSKWLRLFRIAKAIDMMKHEDCNVCHIAFAVGFGDLRTFERAFKRYTHRTPHEFKRQLRLSA